MDQDGLLNALEKSIPQMFYSSEDILALIKSKQRRYNVHPYIFDYDLTPVGYKLQGCLPCLLRTTEHTIDEEARFTFNDFISQINNART